jgi:hypothetical protein
MSGHGVQNAGGCPVCSAAQGKAMGAVWYDVVQNERAWCPECAEREIITYLFQINRYDLAFRQHDIYLIVL